MRIALTVLALALDGLCLALMAAVLFLTHTTESARLGMAILATVVGGNIPALVWGLVPRRPAEDAAVQAGVFS
jgi:hypothetical protein